MNSFDIKDQFPTFKYVAGNLIPASRRLAGYLYMVFKRTWKPAFAVLLLLTVVHGVATFVMGRRVEMELAKIRAKGEPVSAAELAGRPVPDDINGALVYEQAFELIAKEDQKQVAETEGYYDLLFSVDKRNDPKVWANTRKAIETYSRAFSLAEEAAAKPWCRFTTNWEDGASALFPHYMPLRRLAELTATRAIVQAKDGDMAGAARSLGLVIKMSYATKDDANLINMGYRWSIILTASTALKAVADYGRFNDAQARYLADAFSRVDLGPSFVDAMKGERAMILTTFSQIQRNPSDCLGMITRNDSPYWQTYWKIYTSYIGRPLFYKHQLASLRFMQKQIDISRLTYRQTRQLDPKWKAEDWMAQRGAGVLTAITCPVFMGARAGVDAAMAETRGSRLFLAIQSYKNHYGKYPASLTELKAAVHWNLNTTDPFTGNDFIYKRVKGGLLLYSVGINLKDDGGHDIGPRSQLPADIVWRINPTSR